MSAKSFVNRTTVPSVRVNTGSANANSLIVNHRNLGERGSMSGDFGSGSATSREKMQLRHLMAKNNSALYENNPVVKRRMEQQIAAKAGELYGIDPKKLMHAGSQTVSEGRSGALTEAATHYGMGGSLDANKSVSGAPGATTSQAWRGGWTDNYGLQEKMKMVRPGRA